VAGIDREHELRALIGSRDGCAGDVDEVRASTDVRGDELAGRM
jgi:hypothetical protein